MMYTVHGTKTKTYNCPDQDLNPDPHRKWKRREVQNNKMETAQKSPQAPNLKQDVLNPEKKIKTYNCTDQDVNPDIHRKWKPRECKKQNENTTKIPTSTKPET